MSARHRSLPQAPDRRRVVARGPAPRPPARDRLVVANLGLVHTVAHRLAARLGIDHRELVGVGVLALMQAIDRYDRNRGTALSTFAIPRIQGMMLDHARELQGWRRATTRLRRRLSQAEVRAAQVSQSRPGIAEIAAALELAPARFLQLRDRAVAGDVVAAGGGAEWDRVAAVPDERGLDFEQAVELDDLLAWVRRGIRRLPPRHRRVLTAYFLHGLPYLAIGRRLAVTESRVAQLVHEGLERLRHLLDIPQPAAALPARRKAKAA